MKTQENLLEPLDVDISRLPAKGRNIKFSVSDNERENICGAFGLSSLDNLQASILLKPWRKGGVEATGNIMANLSQPCVVTLEPVVQIIDEEVSAVFLPEGSPLAKPKIDKDGEMVIDPEGADLPETFAGTIINVSDIIVEYLTLAIEPHPRAPGAELPETDADNDEDDERPPSPFAVLAQLKNQKPN